MVILSYQHMLKFMLETVKKIFYITGPPVGIQPATLQYADAMLATFKAIELTDKSKHNLCVF